VAVALADQLGSVLSSSWHPEDGHPRG
jgi:hypothetical protein